MSRFFKHLIWQLNFSKILSDSVLEKIEEEISRGEKLHTGQVVFIAEYAFNIFEILDEKTSSERALELFSQYGVWDTEENCGVLLYCLFAERKIEILADRGIAKLVDENLWSEICREISDSFQKRDFETGLLKALKRINEILIKYFPSDGNRINEIDNKPIVIR